MTTTTDRAAGRMPRAAARCATTARKAGRQALVILWLLAAGFAGLAIGGWVLTMSPSLPPGEWRQVVLRSLAVFVALVTFWIAYGFPRDMWRTSRERAS